MITTMCPQPACTPSRLGMPAHRSASVTSIGGVVIGADVRDRAGNGTAVFAKGDAWATSAWSPPTG